MVRNGVGQPDMFLGAESLTGNRDHMCFIEEPSGKFGGVLCARFAQEG